MNLFNRNINKLRDLFKILSGLWVMLLFDLLAIVAFLLVEQGRDVLLVVTEYAADFDHFWTLLALFIALMFWCISSEFSTKVLSYLSDNSGRSLEPERVECRKKYQFYISRFALFFPLGLMFLAFINTCFINFGEISNADNLYNFQKIIRGTCVVLFLIASTFGIIWFLYPGGLIIKWSKKFKRLRWLRLSVQEGRWASKLYGIFNDVRVDLPDPADEYKGKDLPRNRMLPNGMILPSSRYFSPFPENPICKKGNPKTWMFKVNFRFYRRLIKQLLVLTILAGMLILSVGIFFPISWYGQIGATAIICLSFACWQIVYVFLSFLDKAQPFPVRFTLIVWLSICSIINQDHPVRTIYRQKIASCLASNDPRSTLNDHFDRWYKRLEADTVGKKYYRVDSGKRVPVIFVSAEGGALRTGAFTGMLLARLQAKFPELKNYIYAYSSVSGGTLGSNFFNAQTLRAAHNPSERNAWISASKEFFKTDFLSALTAKLVFGEILNYFIPFPIQRADRAIALEKSFEAGWGNAYGNDQNLMESSFSKTFTAPSAAIFMNTTEVETGIQNVWSNVNLEGLPLATSRDLYLRSGLNLRYSSAINLSDRFPLISPAAAFRFKDGTKDSIFKRHFVDGGYYENKGSETLTQVLKALKLEKYKVKPYVLQFNFSGDSTIKSVTKFNEITEIIGTIYNTRIGRGRIAQDDLKNQVRILNGEFISLNSENLPMNWLLSNTLIDQLDVTLAQLVGGKNSKKVTHVLDSTSYKELRKLFFYDQQNLK
ncbi:hypothetical protein ACJVDH_04105 [Pedobacter sp. AW1-32]|uniref:hypothetical protein n=1 Tax=Pedobacter sp. AW1-32 TaxID=3383026 RepID=UPI003FEFC94E